MSKLFAMFFSEAGGDEGWSMAFRDATPETGCTQSHCLIRLSIQLTLLYRQGQGSNQFNMVAGGGQLRSGCSEPTYKYIQHWSRHIGYSTAVDLFSHAAMLPLCAVLLQSCSHIILLTVSETFGECVTSSARLVWLICVKPWHAK